MRIGIGLTAALVVALLSPAAAYAQAKEDKAVTAAIAKGRAKGMADTPTLMESKALGCTVADAYLKGTGAPSKGPDGKPVPGASIYEVSCQDGRGFVVGNPAPEPIDCLVLASAAAAAKAKDPKAKPTVCDLPGNADPKKGLIPVAQKAGVSCPIDKARWVGEDTTNKYDLFEVGCSTGEAFLVDSPKPGSAQKLASRNCSGPILQGQATCEFTTKASVLQSLGVLASGGGRKCDVGDARYVGTKTSGGDFLEISCADKTGFMLETTAAGAFARTVECGAAESIGGGCKLTAVSVAGDTADVATYTRKAKEIGFPCAVSKYRSLGLEGPKGRELVELSCSDRADGAFALIPVDAGQKGEYYNCIRAEARGQTCRLSEKAPLFEKLTNQLQNKGKACKISSTRGIGQNANAPGQDIVEIGCTGAAGAVVVFDGASDALNQVMTCDQAKGVGAACQIK